MSTKIDNKPVEFKSESKDVPAPWEKNVMSAMLLYMAICLAMTPPGSPELTHKQMFWMFAPLAITILVVLTIIFFPIVFPKKEPRVGK